MGKGTAKAKGKAKVGANGNVKATAPSWPPSATPALRSLQKALAELALAPALAPRTSEARCCDLALGRLAPDLIVTLAPRDRRLCRNIARSLQTAAAVSSQGRAAAAGLVRATFRSFDALAGGLCDVLATEIRRIGLCASGGADFQSVETMAGDVLALVAALVDLDTGELRVLPARLLECSIDASKIVDPMTSHSFGREGGTLRCARRVVEPAIELSLRSTLRDDVVDEILRVMRYRLGRLQESWNLAKCSRKEKLQLLQSDEVEWLRAAGSVANNCLKRHLSEKRRRAVSDMLIGVVEFFEFPALVDEDEVSSEAGVHSELRKGNGSVVRKKNPAAGSALIQLEDKGATSKSALSRGVPDYCKKGVREILELLCKLHSLDMSRLALLLAEQLERSFGRSEEKGTAAHADRLCLLLQHAADIAGERPAELITVLTRCLVACDDDAIGDGLRRLAFAAPKLPLVASGLFELVEAWTAAAAAEEEEQKEGKASGQASVSEPPNKGKIRRAMQLASELREHLEALPEDTSPAQVSAAELVQKMLKARWLAIHLMSWANGSDSEEDLESISANDTATDSDTGSDLDDFIDATPEHNAYGYLAGKLAAKDGDGERPSLLYLKEKEIPNWKALSSALMDRLPPPDPEEIACKRQRLSRTLAAPAE